MIYAWDEGKRTSNLLKHGLDFADAEKVFSGPVVLFEDTRSDYGEQRMIAIGLLDDEIRIISMRKADSDETDLYYKNVGYF